MFKQALARGVDNYDAFVQDQSIHNSPLRAILRDISIDTMSGWSSDAIVKREASMIRPRDRVTEFSSLLTAYKLLDVVAGLEPTNALAPALLHKKMPGDFAKYKVYLVIGLYMQLF